MNGITPQQALDLALEHHRAGRLAQAEPIYRQLLAHEPENPDVLHLLGVLACGAGHLEAGLTLIEQSIARQPLARYYINYSTQLMTAGRPDDAAAAAQAAIRLEPETASGHYNLGVAREQQRRWGDAIAAYRTALRLQPDYALATLNLGTALAASAQVDQAIALYREALRLDPTNATIATNLGGFLSSRGDLTGAIATYRAALAIAPDNAYTRNNLAVALKDEGEIEAAITELRHCLALNPGSAEVQSNLIFTLHYLPGHAGLAEEQAAWNLRSAAPLTAAAAPHGNDRSPERRLRIGYVSPDLRNHVVGRALWPVFAQHDRRVVEVVCYSGANPDAFTERFRERADQWRDIARWSDERLAAHIRADRVDILVDLALHTSEHRLLAFARRPAPLQVAWLGYPGTTGLQAMDYWLADRFLAPPAPGPEPAFECPLRLPDAWTVYDPPTDSPAPNALPASTAGHVTFASFNNFAKLSPATWDVWARLLGEVEHSRLMLLVKSARQRELARNSLRQRGIAPERVIFQGFQALAPDVRPASFLARYHEADIALDPFPYNGMTTTCEALWMGVPVVALIGDLPVSRASFSLLSNVGLPELAATSAEEYVRLAAELARDLPRLSALRSSLRDRVKASPLLDAQRFARNLETAFREIWRRWCGRG